MKNILQTIYLSWRMFIYEKSIQEILIKTSFGELVCLAIYDLRCLATHQI
jgi:hypothetical protein